MNKEALINWLREQQPKLENILLNSAEEYFNNYSLKRTFSFDARKTGEEMWLLGRGGDLCYDRPSIGFNYSLWYHPKRINTFLRYFTDLIYDSKDEKSIDIFDLGAGTGAVLWAVGLVVSGLKKLKMPCPNIRVINIDTSAFMIIYNYNYLWKNFILEYPDTVEICKEGDYRLNSWSTLDEINSANVWLCASYLFDHSENSQAIAEDFKEIITQYKPNRVLLLSALQKRAYVDTVASAIQTLNYSSYNSILANQIFSGSLARLYEFRNRISQQLSLNLSGTPRWDIDNLYGKVLINNSPQLGLDFNNLNLFVQPERNRTKIKLTNQQNEAAKITDTPTLVIGPAGCGKSVVLTQKIKNILENSKVNGNYDVNKKILVTTFNKGLVRYLGNWIEQLLEPDKFVRRFGTNFYGNEQDYSYFTFTNSTKINIYVMHFDVLPTKIGNVQWENITNNGADIEDFHFEQMRNAIESYTTKNKIDLVRFKKILNPEFLLDEYHRIIYGNLCTCYSKKNSNDIEYSTISRDGRGNNPRVDIRTGRRKIVWGIVNTYLTFLKRHRLESFIIRRHKWLKSLLAKDFQNKFTHIIVDEFQDCTRADYEIFYQLLQDHNNLTLAGDIAQSINIGHSLYIPRSDDPQMKRFKKQLLEGSFRLPFRVSECIKPLSVNINKRFGEREGVQANIINPFKGAPPGSRPIFVYANDTDSAAEKIKDIFFAYNKALKLDKVTIFERDIELNSALSRNQTPSETEIILRTKGLEKNCVIWSTRMGVDTTNEKEEFVYTILTRTVSLLIIVVFPTIQTEYIEIIKQFVPDRLILWDEESETKYIELCQLLSNDLEQEDLDDTIDNSIVDVNEESLDTIVV